MARRSRRSQFIGVWIVAAVLVNLPLVHSTWMQNRIERDGVEVTATVSSTEKCLACSTNGSG